MTAPVTLRGSRVVLRPWRFPEDLEPLAAINGDTAVMRHFLKPMDRAESDAWAARIAANFRGRGYGFWAVELPGEGLIGAAGIQPIAFEADFAPGTEIGWRIASRFQRRGFAEEAARLALAHGFGPAGLTRIHAWTPPGNEPSWRLMEKLGMRRLGLFDHPRVPQGHPLRPHLLYVIERDGGAAARIAS